jgi:hypothetical protein
LLVELKILLDTPLPFAELIAVALEVPSPVTLEVPLLEAEESEVTLLLESVAVTTCPF